MYIDEYGKRWFKGNLHTHTTNSDGKKTPEETIELYKENGYDFLALTDHWKVSATEMRDGILLLSGCEYDWSPNVRDGVYHIVAVGMKETPEITRENTPVQGIEQIHAAGGLAILAHPAWSLNTPAQIKAIPGIDATEIYNSVSGLPRNCRPYSGAVLDMLAAEGYCLPLVASDDTHFYIKEDTCRSYTMVQADACTPETITAALREGKFYATQGPRISVEQEDRTLRIRCTPAQSIVCFTDTAWESHRAEVGDGITETAFTMNGRVGFARIEVTDAEGNTAWSGYYRFG